MQEGCSLTGPSKLSHPNIRRKVRFILLNFIEIFFYPDGLLFDDGCFLASLELEEFLVVFEDGFFEAVFGFRTFFYGPQPNIFLYHHPIYHFFSNFDLL